MSRVIHTDTPGKRRNQLMRTAAELLRHLSQKNDVDAEAKDMLALLVFTLRDIADGIEESTVAWEKRDYWMKAEEFRAKWNWTHRLSTELENLIFDEKWDELPAMMVKLLPHFSDIKVNKLTRKDQAWLGCYQKLLSERV